MDYKKLFSAVPEAIVVLSPDYKVLEATDAYLAVTMRTREQLVGKDFLAEFPENPADDESRNLKTLRDSLDAARTTKKVDYFPVARYDIPRPASQGGGFDLRYWEASHTPVLDENGEVAYIIQHTTDVTERELAKQAAQENEHRFRFMAEAIPMLVSTSDAQGKLNYFNKSWVTYTGLDQDELIAKDWEDLVCAEDLEAMLARWKKASQSGTEMQAEVRIRDKYGADRWHIIKSAPMTNAQGEVQMWVTCCTDIHHTRSMVQELLASNEQAAALADQVHIAYKKVEAERKALESVILQAPAYFCILQVPDFRYELVNPMYQSLFPGKDFVGRTVAEVLPEAVEQGFLQPLEGVLNTGEYFSAEEVPFKMPLDVESEYREIYVNFSYHPILNEHHEVSRILAFAYDVTEQVKFKNQLRELGYSL